MSKTMKVQFAVDLMNLQGEPLKERAGIESVRAAMREAGIADMMLDQAIAILRGFWGTGGDPKETILTAQSACMAALQLPDQAMMGAERVDRMRLALKLLDKEPVEISEKEKEIILKAIEKAYASPVVYYRINELFNEAAVERDRPAAAAQ
ncbi:MAG: hypothetical protein OEW90_05020 [Betaproteobacteria bacterium]|nr:hypothetical protein [Betaproteobacteria bacterium]MDH4323481.1 hypothetical protein [Betaproteobacteria bacterium]